MPASVGCCSLVSCACTFTIVLWWQQVACSFLSCTRHAPYWVFMLSEISVQCLCVNACLHMGAAQCVRSFYKQGWIFLLSLPMCCLHAGNAPPPLYGGPPPSYGSQPPPQYAPAPGPQYGAVAPGPAPYMSGPAPGPRLGYAPVGAPPQYAAPPSY